MFVKKPDDESVDNYIRYSKLIKELSAHENAMCQIRRDLKMVKDELQKHTDDGVALEMTSHSFSNITARLEDLMNDNPGIYDKIMKDNLFVPSNLKSFVIDLISNARKNGMFNVQDSKNNRGAFEYHYKIIMDDWSNETHLLEFTAIVEAGVLKTGYFNWNKR
jgi:hypothetical protein